MLCGCVQRVFEEIVISACAIQAQKSCDFCLLDSLNNIYESNAQILDDLKNIVEEITKIWTAELHHVLASLKVFSLRFSH